MSQKIGIDFHGVITDAPKEFAVFCREIRKRGVRVYIISGGPKKDVEQYLKAHNIEFDVVWAILDFYEAKGKVEYFNDGSYKVDTALWNKAKGEYCVREGIDFHIDDSNVYDKYFVTPYCKYDLANDACELEDGLKVDFKNAGRAADEVVNFLKQSRLGKQNKVE